MLTLLSFLTPTGSFGTAIFHAVAATIGVIKREDRQPKERGEGNLPS